jgi:Flp pilus assembly pilin Flp
MVRLLSDQRGTATVEYVLLLVIFTIAMATVLYSMGPGLVDVFQMRVLWLALPFP